MEQRKSLELHHFDMMQKMRKAWQEQLENMKQAHVEAKQDLENLISKREQQLREMKEGG